MKTLEALRDKLIYGNDEVTKMPVIVDPVSSPGALFVGGMGSGKSIAARFTLAARFASNSDQDLYILADPLKRMLDFECFFEYKRNVVTALEIDKIVRVIDMVHSEMMERQSSFSKTGSGNIHLYEKTMREKDRDYKLARIFLVIEEFHSVSNSVKIDFKNNVDVPGSTAYKLKQIAIFGRSYGINIIAQAQRAGVGDFPSELKPGITQIMAFRVNSPGDVASIGLPQAANIKLEQRGRCVYEHGSMQFPFWDEETITDQIGKNYRPLSASLLAHSVTEYHSI